MFPQNTGQTARHLPVEKAEDVVCLRCREDVMPLRITLALASLWALPNALAAEPIHDAATSGDAETVLRLLSEGTPVNQFDTSDSFGRPTTALYRATMAGRNEVVEILLDAGADPTLRADDSRSVLNPMQVAAKFGRTDILQMFLDRGFDPNAPRKRSDPTSSRAEIAKG